MNDGIVVSFRLAESSVQVAPVSTSFVRAAVAVLRAAQAKKKTASRGASAADGAMGCSWPSTLAAVQTSETITTAGF